MPAAKKKRRRSPRPVAVKVPRRAPGPLEDEDPEEWVDLRRAHRRKLSKGAEDHWEEKGQEAKARYLQAVRAALEAEGFRTTMMQWRHKGHAYGLIKDLGKMQIHVRVYDDGVIDAEVEVHKRYIQHLWSPRPSAHEEVQAILERHGISTHLVNEQYLPQVGPLRDRFPDRLWKVAHVAGTTAVVAGGLVAASLARLIVKKRGRE
jgi:hypothetical protein